MVILDLVPQFGSIPILLDVVPDTTLDDLVTDQDYRNVNAIEKHLYLHMSGIKVLAGPQSPEMVTADIVSAMIENLKTAYDFIIIDTEAAFSAVTNQALDNSEFVLLIMDL